MKTTVAQLLLEHQAVKIQPNNPFTWTSGIKSPIYCDNRILISYPEAFNTITLAFKELVDTQEFDVIAGTATAGIPWAAFLSYELNIPMIYVRKKAKEHGTKSHIEGILKEGQKVLLIEDLVSTGKSSVAAVEAIRKEGGEIDTVAAIFQYGFPIASIAYSDLNCELQTITDFATLLEQMEHLNEEEKKEVLRFTENPQEWKK